MYCVVNIQRTNYIHETSHETVSTNTKMSLMLKTPVVVIQLTLYNEEGLVSSLLHVKNFLESNIRKVSCECILLANIHLFHKCSLQIPLMAQKMSDTVLILMALI